jgi:hypothetical protein
MTIVSDWVLVLDMTEYPNENSTENAFQNFKSLWHKTLTI